MFFFSVAIDSAVSPRPAVSRWMRVSRKAGRVENLKGGAVARKKQNTPPPFFLFSWQKVGLLKSFRNDQQLPFRTRRIVP